MPACSPGANSALRSPGTAGSPHPAAAAPPAEPVSLKPPSTTKAEPKPPGWLGRPGRLPGRAGAINAGVSGLEAMTEQAELSARSTNSALRWPPRPHRAPAPPAAHTGANKPAGAMFFEANHENKARERGVRRARFPAAARILGASKRTPLPARQGPLKRGQHPGMCRCPGAALQPPRVAVSLLCRSRSAGHGATINSH